MRKEFAISLGRHVVPAVAFAVVASGIAYAAITEEFNRTLDVEIPEA